MQKKARNPPLIREIFKGDDNAAVVGKFDMKTNKYPLQGRLNKLEKEGGKQDR